MKRLYAKLGVRNRKELLDVCLQEQQGRRRKDKQ
jgi:hypothetical protein